MHVHMYSVIHVYCTVLSCMHSFNLLQTSSEGDPLCIEMEFADSAVRIISIVVLCNHFHSMHAHP